MNQTRFNEPSDDIELLKSAAVAAGVMAMGYFRRDIKTWTKENASPVSEADYLVDRFLANTLKNARPDYGWMSEETGDDPIRMEKQRIFVVDPIDGTRGFIRGDAGWSICLTVVENGIAISGVIYAPALDELYEAVINKGAMLNGKPLLNIYNPGNIPTILAPETVHRALETTGLEYTRMPTLPSLAHSLVQIATGKTDVVLARRGAQDWDIAAASLILSECGIILEDVCLGKPLFNKEETRHGALAAMQDNSLKGAMHEILTDIYGCPEIKTAANF